MRNLLLPSMSDAEKNEFDELGSKLALYTSQDIEIIKSTIAKVQRR